ncbi:MAG: DUF4156 domain-containing protein [Luteimonas sp.]
MRLLPLVSAAVLLTAVVLTAVPGCTWVHMAPGASSVQVLTAAPTGCEQRGEVEVSVKESIGFYDRNPVRIREELETLARNEAPGLSGNAVQPLDGYEDGRQRFAVWRCPG